jgi:hypothetical protein
MPVARPKMGPVLTDALVEIAKIFLLP